MPMKSGVTQRTRSQPGRVSRCHPVAGGAPCACGSWAWVTAVTLLRLLREVLDQRVEIGRGDLRAEDLRHRVRIPRRDVRARAHDRLLDERLERPAMRIRRELLQLVEI